MTLPPLLNLPNETACREHFQKDYLPPAVIHTFDGIHVRFFPRNFDHAFYCESVRGSGIDDRFSHQRARRMDWITAVLQDGSAELYRREMRDKRGHPTVRRIALRPVERYVVVIQMAKSGKRANFVTAYVVRSDEAFKKMRGNPAWPK